MKHLIATVCLCLLASPALAWEQPQSGGVRLQQVQPQSPYGAPGQLPQSGQTYYCYSGPHCGFAQAQPQNPNFSGPTIRNPNGPALTNPQVQGTARFARIR